MSVRELHSSSRFNKPAIANAKRTVKTTLIDGHVPMLSMPSRVAAVIIIDAATRTSSISSCHANEIRAAGRRAVVAAATRACAS
jgi:hypothetical protein